jgi:predicted DNA-binding protein (UPF0251 family)
MQEREQGIRQVARLESEVLRLQRDVARMEQRHACATLSLSRSQAASQLQEQKRTLLPGQQMQVNNLQKSKG